MGALRQVHARNLVWILAGLAILGVTGGMYFTQSSQKSAYIRDQRAAEIRDLENRFQTEKHTIQTKLEDLRTKTGASAEALTSFLLTERPSSSWVKRYLLDESGRILAHANASEVGTKAPGLAELFRAHEKDGHVSSTSWEGYPTTIRFERIPSWNAFFAMERTHVPVKAGLTPGPIQSAFFLAGLIFGLAFLAAGMSPREEIVFTEPEPKILIPRELPPVVPVPPRFNSLVQPTPRPDSELGRFLADRVGRSQSFDADRLRREKSWLETFDRDARRSRGDSAALETKLVESVARATKRPVLFFRYDSFQGIALLSAEAGHVGAHSLLGSKGGVMSFSLGDTLVNRIHEEELRGRKYSLWDHAPLSRLLMSRLGISTFDAWPMIGAKGWMGGRGKLLGVLVIAQAGVESTIHRDFLGTLLDRASRHYEA